MKAWILEKQASVEERPLKLAEVPTPHPKDDEGRLRVLVCGVCRTDIHIAEGDLPLRKSPILQSRPLPTPELVIVPLDSDSSHIAGARCQRLQGPAGRLFRCPFNTQ